MGIFICKEKTGLERLFLKGANMGLLDSIFGSDSEVESRSVLDPAQRQLLGQTSQYLQSGLGLGATAATNPLYTQTPDYYQSALQQFGQGGLQGTGTVLNALQQQAGGVPAYKFDPGQITQQWNQNFAQPMMSAYRQYVQPLVQEQFNLPGLSGSAIAGRGVSNAANQFFGQSVQPQLYNALLTGQQQAFQSGEAAAGRQLAGASALGQLPLQAGQAQLSDQERILAALRGDEQRLRPEANPYLQAALGLSTGQTRENIAFQGQEGMLSSALGAGVGALGGLGGLAAGTSLFGGPEFTLSSLFS